MTEAVKQGWSWPAFFFNPIWAMVKKMWLLGSLTLVGEMILYGLFGSDFPRVSLADLLNVGIGIAFGLQGNAWREHNLVSRGFKFVGTVTAATAEGALARHVSGLATTPFHKADGPPTGWR